MKLTPTRAHIPTTPPPRPPQAGSGLSALDPATVPSPPPCPEAALRGSEEGGLRGSAEGGRAEEREARRRAERADAARRRAARAATRAAAGRAYAGQRREMARRLAQCEAEVVERHRARAAEWRSRRDAGEPPHHTGKERCGALRSAAERCRRVLCAVLIELLWNPQPDVDPLPVRDSGTLYCTHLQIPSVLNRMESLLRILQ